jgi:hypothetical protein
LLGNLKVRGPWEDLKVDVRAMLKWINVTVHKNVYGINTL